MKMKHFNIMVAVCKKDGFANKGKVPWPCYEKDYNYYVNKVNSCQQGKKNALVHGRVTWFDTGDERKNPARYNIVISTTLSGIPEDAHYVARSFEDAVLHASNQDVIEHIWIFGGEQVFKAALNHPFCERIYLTRIEEDYEVDQYFPTFRDQFSLEETVDVQKERGTEIRFEVYKRKS